MAAVLLEDDAAEHQIRIVNRGYKLGVSCACRLRANLPPLKLWRIVPLAEALAVYERHAAERKAS